MLNFPKDLVSETNRLFYKFVWNGVSKVKKSAFISDIENGGAKMPDLQSILDTQKVMWGKRYLQTNYHSWK